MKKVIYNLIRRFFWKDYDYNEEFSCGYCGKEMYGRYLFCSDSYAEKFGEV